MTYPPSILTVALHVNQPRPFLQTIKAAFDL